MEKREEKRNLESIPVGSLRIIPLSSCKSLGEKVDSYLVKWRTERENEHKNSLAFAGYQRDSYILDARLPRFGSGEGKGEIKESVRGTDLFILVDVCNYSLTYSMAGHENHMSPDDHYQDLKRVIAAVGGKARRITVIMPFLYESRQHKRTARESLDCAIALQELIHMGVDNIITFDAHDPRVQNAIPLHGFETVQPAYQFIKGLLRNVKDLKLDSEHMMVISPDEGGM
ncbi:MAG: ribose-phosphate pyrophosphokinase-like domain-containing protein, partial [Lachnospiraceae bacterium]